MKNKTMLKTVRQNYSLIFAPLVTAVILLIVFAINGIFPFGKSNVEYYDMAQGIIPNFYHIWDALHTKDTSLWFNWYSGLGVNDTANASLSVFWLALLVIPRRLVGKAMGLYVIMTFSLSALTANLFLRIEAKTKPFVSTLLSVCYAFCGFSVMYYTNAWQDTVLLFPLFMLAWCALMKKGNVIPYILLTVLNVLCGYYVFILLMLYVFFMSFLYLNFVSDKKDRKRRSFELGLSTVLGFGISAAVLFPKLSQTLSSERFVSETGFDFSQIVKQYLEIAKTTLCKSDDKWSMLFCVSLPLAIIILGIAKNRNKKKINLFFTLNILLLAVLIVCEGANALMHLGDYKYFPMRMGYALSFAFIWAAGYYSKFLSLNKFDFKDKTGKNIAAAILNIVVSVALFILSYLVIKKLDTKFDFKYSVLYILPLLVLIYIVIFSGKNRVFDYKISFSLILAETMALTSIFIPYAQTDMLEKEHNPAYISTSQSIKKKLDIDESKTDRIKTIGTTLNCNYGTVIGKATIADWTHLIPSNIQSSLISLGYSGEYTRLHDSGGTAFTDALLGVKNVLSVKKESEELYTKLDKAKGYNYYSCNYTLPYGIVVDRKVLNITNDNADWKKLNNELYTAISGDNENIVSDAKLELKSKNGEEEIYSFKSKQNSIAYFRLEGAQGVRVYVNGKKIVIPSIDREKATKYPGRFNRNLICLGSFGEDEVEIKLVFKEGKYEQAKDFRKNGLSLDEDENKYFSCEVGLMSLDKLKNVCDMYNYKTNAKAENYSLSVDAKADDEQKVLLLPLQYNGCWNGKVNGKSSEVKSVLGVFSAVELDEGSNKAELHFMPTGLKSGLVVSAASMIVFALVLLLEKKNKFAGKVLCSGVYALYCVLFALAFVLIYAIPILYLVLHLLIK